MRAVICRAWGAVEDLTIEEVPAPAPAADEVLIDVRATSVNYADSIMVAGHYQTRPPFPFSPGLETAGVVSRCGARATRFKPGDRVMATLARGDTLLVLGAAGGVGLTAVEIGKAMGARVIAGASTAEKLAVARAHGADDLVNYATEKLTERVMALTGDKGADVCFDPVGGALADAALSSLGWGGRMLLVGFVGGVQQIPANRLLVKNRSALGSSLRYYRWHAPDKIRRSVEALVAWYGEGKLKPCISHRLPLEKTVEAITLLTARKAHGKVVVLPGPR